jgi:hypothetical protein
VEHLLGKRLAQLVRLVNIVLVLVKQQMKIFVPLVVTNRPPDKHLTHAMDCVHLVNIVFRVQPVAQIVRPVQWLPRPVGFHK